MMNDWCTYGSWTSWLMIALAILFLAAVVVGMVFLLRGLIGAGTMRDGHATSPPRSADEARQIVRRRYASGEIERAEFEEKMRDLDR